MSKGEIVSSQGAGLYRVRLKYAVDRVQEELDRINERIAELAVLVPQLKAEVIQAEAKAADISREIDLLIGDYQADPEQFGGQIRGLQVALVKQRGELARLTYRLELLQAEQLSLLKRRGQLEAAPEHKTLDAWCADFTEELAGEVGLADINDEGGRGVIIQPAFDGAAGYNPSRDGDLFPDVAQSGAQIFFNAAILPGVQKWRPRYRIGTISDLNGDACTVTLDDAFSSAQDLSINQQPVYQSVPIEYMDCNGSAFEDGDRVLVRFTDSGPLVIGFEKEPVQCSDLSFVFWPTRYELELPEQLSTATLYGQPYETEAGEVNPPLGTEDGHDGVWRLNYRSGSYKIEKGLPPLYGYRNWLGEKGAVLSWSGPPTRFYDVFGLGDPATEDFAGQPGDFEHWRKDWAADRFVYYNNSVLWEFQQHVHGAAFQQVAGAWYLIAVVGPHSYQAEQGSVVRVQLDEYFRPVDEAQAETLYSFDFSGTLRSMTDWYFSRSGGRAVCTARDIGGFAPAQIYRLDLDLDSGLASTELWDSSDNIGTSTLDYVNIDESYPSNYFHREVDQSLTLTARPRPVYVEYIGEERVQINHKLPSYSRDSLAVGTEDQVGTGPFQKSFTRQETGSASSAAQIVTDTGKVLAVAPFRRYSDIDISHNINRYQDSGSGAIYYTGSRSESVQQVFSTTSDEIQIVAIDARFEFCVIWSDYTENNYTVSSSAPVPSPENMFEPIWTETRTGPSRRIEKLSIFQDGSLVTDLPLIEPDESTSGSVETSAWPPTPQSYGTASFTSTGSVDDSPETVYGSRGLLWGSGYKANGKKAHCIVYHEPDSNGESQPVWNSHMDGYGDVIRGLLERDEKQGYVLNKLSIQ